MPELDHIFIMCTPGAGPEAAALLRAGLTEGSPNTHPGQGTACRRFFFQDFYLELLWVSDADDVRSEPVARTRLWERWSRRADGACPFGVMVRADPGASSAEAPFDAWTYQPQYFPAHVGIGVASDAPLEEPALFYFPFAREPQQQNVEQTTHARVIGRLTSVAIGTPLPAPRSAGSKALEALGLLKFRREPDYALHLTFGEGRAGRVDDLRPAVPVILYS